MAEHSRYRRRCKAKGLRRPHPSTLQAKKGAGMSASARQSDERLLTILDRAYRGETLSRIADDMGLAKESVRTQTRRVLRADLAESGEPSGVVRLAYPWARV